MTRIRNINDDSVYFKVARMSRQSLRTIARHNSVRTGRNKSDTLRNLREARVIHLMPDGVTEVIPENLAPK